MDATLTVQGTSNQGTALQPAGVLNLASQLPGPVAPGELVTLIGSGIGPSSPVQPGGNTMAGGASVLFDGTPAPILYAGMDEIQLVVPYEISGESATTMQVIDNGEVAATVFLPVAAASPAVFTSDGSGVGARRHPESGLNSEFAAESGQRRVYRGFICDGSRSDDARGRRWGRDRRCFIYPLRSCRLRSRSADWRPKCLTQVPRQD